MDTHACMHACRRKQLQLRYSGERSYKGSRVAVHDGHVGHATPLHQWYGARLDEAVVEQSIHDHRGQSRRSLYSHHRLRAT